MTNIYEEFHSFTDSAIFTTGNITKIKVLTSIENTIPPIFLGLLSNIVNNEPQYYYNREVSDEVSSNLTAFYKEDPDKFLQISVSNQSTFFSAINSYYHILDLYKELDSVAFENELKIKLYYLPVIQQTMEFCLNSFYSGINQIVNEFVDADFSKTNKLGGYKNNLTSKRLGDYTFSHLTNININLRNAISHGKIDFSENSIIYAYTERDSRKTIYATLEISKLDNMKNELFDIASGALIGWFKFIIDNKLSESLFKDTQVEEIQFEYFKLRFQNDNIQISSFSKNTDVTAQLNIHIQIKNINEENSIYHLIVMLLKAMYHFFPDYDRYFVNYKHPFSISGMISLNKEVIKKILNTSDIATIDKAISNDQSLFLVHSIQEYDPNYKAYKFQVFQNFQSSGWELLNIDDISNDKFKRYKCNLIIDDTSISKEEIISTLFSVSSKIRHLENQKNPYTIIKYGKVEADVIIINVFYRQYERKLFSLLSDNEYFICSVYYYRNKSIHRLTVPYSQNYLHQNIKRFDIYWNQEFLKKNTLQPQ